MTLAIKSSRHDDNKKSLEEENTHLIFLVIIISCLGAFTATSGDSDRTDTEVTGDNDNTGDDSENNIDRNSNGDEDTDSDDKSDDDNDNNPEPSLVPFP